MSLFNSALESSCRLFALGEEESVGLMGTERFWIQKEMDVPKCLLGPSSVGLGLLESRDNSGCVSPCLACLAQSRHWLAFVD